MATVPTKTVQTAPITWQDITASTEVISSIVNTANTWSASFAISIAHGVQWL